VVQEALLEASERWEEYQEKSSLSPYLWLRLMTLQRLALVHRQNLSVKARDVRREVGRARNHDYPEASSVALAELLVGRCSTPSQAASQAELRQHVGEALAQMDLIDREVLTLRHFEQLSNKEAAEVLDLTEAAASKRYLRALRRIKEILAASGLDSEN
jgi:RNA polymerase sigma-70 factor (ECF subfamily)